MGSCGLTIREFGIRNLELGDKNKAEIILSIFPIH